VKEAHLLRRTVNLVQLLLGVGLAALPGFVAYTDDFGVAYSAVVAGAAAAAVALLAFVTQWRWPPWLMGGISLWVLAAPLALGLQRAVQTQWIQVVLGAALLATALADWASMRAPAKAEQNAAPLQH
jgi:hypothetical protein